MSRLAPVPVAVAVVRDPAGRVVDRAVVEARAAAAGVALAFYLRHLRRFLKLR